ncbi:MAG: hypothetical protein WC980_09410 [Candidatus Brocadiia bacterium]
MGDEKPIKLFTKWKIIIIVISVVIGIGIGNYSIYQGKGTFDTVSLMGLLLTIVLVAGIIISLIWYGNKPERRQ